MREPPVGWRRSLMTDALHEGGSQRERFIRHRPAPGRADAKLGVASRSVWQVSWFPVMSCRTRTAGAAADSAEAGGAPAWRRHSRGRYRVRGRSADGTIAVALRHWR